MPVVRLSISVFLPDLVYYPLRQLKWRFLSQTPNLWGDRDVEYSFIAAHMPSGPGYALDFGSGASYMSLLAARRGFRVIALDLEPQNFAWHHPRVQFIQGDLLRIDLPAHHFDLIINCSTVEHVGLAGRYGITEERPDGDLEAMDRLRRVMKDDGVMLLTIPVGKDAVFAPLCRVYGEQRLPQLFSGYSVIYEEFWMKRRGNWWEPVEKAEAMAFKAYAGSWNPLKNIYALGCFILRKRQVAGMV
jgi:SAM-dependent methyltransferase